MNSNCSIGQPVLSHFQPSPMSGRREAARCTTRVTVGNHEPLHPSTGHDSPSIPPVGARGRFPEHQNLSPAVPFSRSLSSHRQSTALTTPAHNPSEPGNSSTSIEVGGNRLVDSSSLTQRLVAAGVTLTISGFSTLAAAFNKADDDPTASKNLLYAGASLGVVGVLLLLSAAERHFCSCSGNLHGPETALALAELAL